MSGGLGGAERAVEIFVRILSLTSDQALNALFKEGLQATAGAYLQKVYGLTQALAVRVTSLVDLAGGWQAFVDRTREEAGKEKK